jgi:hypothetical protein
VLVDCNVRYTTTRRTSVGPPKREALPSEVWSAVLSVVSRKTIGSTGRVLSDTESGIGDSALESKAVATGAGDWAGSGGREVSAVQPIDKQR